MSIREEPLIPSEEAIRYGRRVIQAEIDRLAGFEQQSYDKDEPDRAERFRRIRVWLERRVMGGEGCVITGLDSRWLKPEFREATAAARAWMRAEDAAGSPSERKEP